MGPVSPPIRVHRQGLDRRGDRGPGVLHQSFLGDTQGLGTTVRAGHRLGTDGRQGGLRGPAPPQAAEIEIEDRRVVGGERRGAVGRAGDGRRGRGHVGQA